MKTVSVIYLISAYINDKDKSRLKRMDEEVEGGSNRYWDNEEVMGQCFIASPPTLIFKILKIFLLIIHGFRSLLLVHQRYS